MGSANSTSYDSSYYDEAKEKYEQLAKKYEGVAGDKLARSSGSNIAETAGKSAVNSSTAAARSAGLNKAQAAIAGMGAGSKAASDNYSAGVNYALTKQQNQLANSQNMVKAANEIDKAKYDGKIRSKTGNMGAAASVLGAAAGLIGAAIASDEELKTIYPDMGDDILNAFRNIRSVEFNYTPEAIEESKTEILPGVDKDEHIGVIAQDVEKVFPETVTDNGSGHKLVDTKELTMANTAAIAELARQLKELKELKEKIQ